MNKSDLTRCTVCCEERKSRYREFSPHAWTALSVWGEVQSSEKNQTMCNPCYAEFRDLLIERASEVELYASTMYRTQDVAKVHELTSFRSSEVRAKAQIAS